MEIESVHKIVTIDVADGAPDKKPVTLLGREATALTEFDYYRARNL